MTVTQLKDWLIECEAKDCGDFGVDLMIETPFNADMQFVQIQLPMTDHALSRAQSRIILLHESKEL